MSDSNDESKIRRALSGDFAEQWSKIQIEQTELIYSEHEGLSDANIEEWDYWNNRVIPEDPELKKEYFEKRRNEIKNKIKIWFRDRKILFVSQWDAESTFREELLINPLLIENPSFLNEWNEFREKQLALSIQLKSDPLSEYAILYQTEPQQIPDEKEFMAYYFNYFSKLGPERSGRLEEVIGPMGSGKSNFLVWKSIRALQKGYVVFTNFALKNVPQSFHKNWHEIHSYTELFEQTISLKNEGYNDIVFWVIDEQGRTPGASSQTTTMREGRWTSEILTIIRKFGVFLTRARQTDNIPQDQISWISILISKNVQNPDQVQVQYLHNGTVEEQYLFTIPSMKQYYDTNDPSLIYMDLNMEMLQKYAIRKQQKGEDPIIAMQSFISIAKKINEAQWKKFESSVDALEAGLDTLIKEDKRGKNPNSLTALNKINKKRIEEAKKRRENAKNSNDVETKINENKR
ncbi:MAG: hypothetical protein QXH07_06125 [Thermoplasmata archaeon]